MDMTPDPKPRTAKEWRQAMAQAREPLEKEIKLVPMLIAQNARLRKALSKEMALSRPPTDIALEVIAETPTQAFAEFLAQVRSDALEEAAKECEPCCGQCARSIRALKSKP